MIDFIFGVEDAKSWHQVNLRQRPEHYSFWIRHMSPSLIANLQTKHCFGAQLYYNTDCSVEGRRIKYGVITISDLVDDLTHWTTMYAAGRFQKPVSIKFYELWSNVNE
jgi:translocator assembly and maintenance protein 41